MVKSQVLELFLAPVEIAISAFYFNIYGYNIPTINGLVVCIWKGTKE
jgi:hypothetical protein